MIFKQEMVDKILAGEKTVTRRPVKLEPVERFGDFGDISMMPAPCRYKVGRTYAVQPGRGKKAVGWIRVLDVRREPLEDYRSTRSALVDEGHREGFRNWFEFRDYWRELYEGFDPTQLVDRIEFELVEGVGS